MKARYSLEYAMSIEQIHAKMFKKALEDPNANAEAVYYVCPVCGNTVMKTSCQRNVPIAVSMRRNFRKFGKGFIQNTR